MIIGVNYLFNLPFHRMRGLPGDGVREEGHAAGLLVGLAQPFVRSEETVIEAVANTSPDCVSATDKL
jgi:hypothetical protein